MDHMHSKRNVYQNQYFNITDYDTIYGNAQMCPYYDANWANNMDDYKSTSSYVLLLRNGDIKTWNSKK
jgi:hypothetical protein